MFVSVYNSKGDWFLLVVLTVMHVFACEDALPFVSWQKLIIYQSTGMLKGIKSEGLWMKWLQHPFSKKI